jgi:glycosyltransferase involved in cell wall biosynthesis
MTFTETQALRIAFVVTRANPIGGVQIHVRDLAVTLKSRGHEPTVVVGGGGPLIDVLRQAEVPVVVLPRLVVPIHPVSDFRALGDIRTALAEVKPDIIPVHSSKAGILGRIAAHRLGIPAVLTAHGWNFTPGISAVPAAAYRQIERLAGPLASRIITVSEFDRKLAIEANIAAAERIVTVYNGIPDIPASLRANPAAPTPRLLMVARFGPQKDHRTLLHALGGLKHQPWALDLVGEGPLSGEMQSLAASLGLGDRVRFLGQRLDVPEILAQAQISVLATNWEGFPLSILEAMRAGLPVVATAVAGVPESVVDGSTGYLVRRGDADALRERLQPLLVDPELRRRQGMAGRSSYERQFTLETFVDKTLEVYETILAERRGLRSSPRTSRPVQAATTSS